MYKRKRKSAFGNIIRTVRLQQGTTQGQVADLAGCTAEMICAMECGVKHLKLDKVPALASALNLDVLELGIELMRETAPQFLACLLLVLGNRHSTHNEG